MKYKVYFTISNSYVTNIEADSEEEAREIVQDAINIDDDAFSYDREWYDGNNSIEEVRLKNERQNNNV